ncbi:MAG: TonB C-terminal domain-containing protein, partial [Candidatus Obscuribacterales bacterium]|nr:TonB C-terminal domain-containing protein [Candidatus Obscuribacterales bacterium]
PQPSKPQPSTGNPPVPVPVPAPVSAPTLKSPTLKAPAPPQGMVVSNPVSPLLMPVKIGSGNVPAPVIASAATESQSGFRPAMINIKGAPGKSNGSGPPAPIGRQGSGNNMPGAPAPSRGNASNPGGSGHLLAVNPSLPRASEGGSGNLEKANPSKDGDGKEISPGVEKEPDWGIYMAELQRKIKRAWFPPKDTASKRVSVIFKIHSNGSLSSLRLEKSSGLALADQAALKAVSNAAPFRNLPEGAPPDVDIQFTFDYNVFRGSRIN